jgi:cytochrome oxidase Cu insertion factor (SCO1/SenC/PrrC family)
VIALRWILGAAVLILAAVVGALLLVGSPSHATPMSRAAPVSDAPAATWTAGKKRAPSFALTDQNGAPVSLAALRGKPVIVTFIDPLCRDFCPTEAQHLNTVVRSFAAGSKPTVVAVSVNTAGNRRPILRTDERKWGLVPQWRWGVGAPAKLARIWHAYGIQVLVTKQTIAGVNVRRVAHTEASYVIDRNGFVRALFVWPYSAKGVVSTLRSLAAQ